MSCRKCRAAGRASTIHAARRRDIKHEYDSQTVKPALLCIDSIGIGAGVADRLNEQNLPVLGVNVSETPRHQRPV